MQQPTRLEGTQLEIQAKDAEYKAALLEWMNAQNALAKAENDSNERSPDDLLRRMQAQRDHDRTIRESKELAAKSKVASVCAYVIWLRIELTASERGRIHEMNLLRFESKMMRQRAALAPERLRAMLKAEADRFVAEANDVQARKKRIASDVAGAIAQRDRLKALVDRR